MFSESSLLCDNFAQWMISAPCSCVCSSVKAPRLGALNPGISKHLCKRQVVPIQARRGLVGCGRQHTGSILPSRLGNGFCWLLTCGLEEVIPACAWCRALLWTCAYVRQRGLSHGPPRSTGDAAPACYRHRYPHQPGKQKSA